MKNVEKHLTPELANYALLILILFFLLQHQGLVFLFICTHFKSNVSNTSIHYSEHGSKFHRSAINLLQVQLFSFFSFHIQRPFKYGHDVLCYFSRTFLHFKTARLNKMNFSAIKWLLLFTKLSVRCVYRHIYGDNDIYCKHSNCTGLYLKTRKYKLSLSIDTSMQ